MSKRFKGDTYVVVGEEPLEEFWLDENCGKTFNSVRGAKFVEIEADNGWYGDGLLVFPDGRVVAVSDWWDRSW